MKINLDIVKDTTSVKFYYEILCIMGYIKIINLLYYWFRVGGEATHSTYNM
jgi:hypothetical protein